ncbi:MAG: glucose-1-phosphate adenylyltransferase [Gemmataceae bacterium]|nr:glucose-1-phosphate adenylyltransferase [Gemmataceae bacterium]
MRTTQHVLAFVMAGGRGERLEPLTRHRTKPAVPFGSRYRIIDFVLSNLVNSGISAIYVLTQYKAQSVLEHIQEGWLHRVAGRHSFIQVVPAQMQIGHGWYRGTADAIYQNLTLLQAFEPDVVVVFGADHIYKMNIRQMVNFHQESGAEATVSCLPVPRASASHFGVVDVDERGKIKRFLEKPDNPPGTPGKPDLSLVSMGNYVFNPGSLRDCLRADAQRKDSSHDFGRDVLPALTQTGVAYAYDFNLNRIPGVFTEEEHAYWRDVGSIEAYYEANLDLKNVQPQLNLFNWKWPIMTARFNDPPAKFVFDEAGRRGVAVQSIVAPGCILAGGYAKDSILGRNVFLDAGCEVHDSILLDNVYVGPGAHVRRAIIDKNNRIEAGQRVGENLEADRQRYYVSDTGIVVIPKASETAATRERNL